MKCINCNNKIKSKDTYCSNCGLNLKNIEVIKEGTNKKSDLIFYLIVIILLIISISVSTWLFLNNNKKEKVDENNIVVNDNEVLFKNFILSVPKGFEKIDDEFIQSDKLLIRYKEYPLSLEQINNNKELLMDTLKKQGYIIEKFEEKIIDEEEYIVVYTKLNNVDYCLLFYEFDSDTNILLTITSNYLSTFQDDWIDIAVDFIKSNKKV